MQEFQYTLMDNILDLHRDLKEGTYKHGPYHHFKISDPKPRDIHKASVRDRLLHHALYRTLYPFFDKTFIADSYSCRKWKGTHRAMNRFREFAYQVSKNHTHTCWILKCDIRKFFASINHHVLLSIVHSYIQDDHTVDLIAEVVKSFSARQSIPKFSRTPEYGKGLPLGNLTSQLLVNIYMNEFDQYAKHVLKAKHYIRYADDFVLLSTSRSNLEAIVPKIAVFLDSRLKLTLHPDKVFIKTLASGVDFLGWVHFPDHRVLRTAAKRRMLVRVATAENEAVWSSYMGLLSHGNSRKLQSAIHETLNRGDLV